MLSPRQKQVSALLAQGKTHREIAQALGISLYTVRTYVERARLRNNCKSSTELAVRFALSVRDGG